MELIVLPGQKVEMKLRRDPSLWFTSGTRKMPTAYVSI